MAKIARMKCDQNYDCENCKHKDCIDGEPFSEKIEINPSKMAASMIFQKYSSDESRQKNVERCRRYKDKNRDKVYAKNKEWLENHREEANRVRRKSLRKKKIQQGLYKFAGTIKYKGFEAFVYRSKYAGVNNYFGFLGEEYFEIDEEDITWLWIRKEV